MAESVDQLVAQLEEKVLADFQAGTFHAYEALQYVQSFVARKKKTLGPAGTSRAVFHAAKLLITSKGGNDVDEAAMASAAGTLLKWFIEDGAGKDYSFHLHPEQTHADQYCDIQHCLTLLEPIDVKFSGPIVDTIYNPLHMLLAKAKVKRNSPLQKRLNKLDILFADVLLRHKKWLGAFKSYVRLADAEKIALVLTNWSAEGLPTEKPLFFARGLLQILADNKASLANDLLHCSQALIADNLNGPKGGMMSASLAIWHVATILTDLVNFAPMPRVDRTKLFGLLYQRYGPLLLRTDSKLLELFMKVGEVHCQFRLETPESQAPNPMAMLQAMLSGGQPPAPRQQQQQQQRLPPSGPASNGPLGGMDINAMMAMMNRLQSMTK